MFQGCTSLTTAPALPATTLVEGCYYGMFNGCTNLVTAPEISATTLAYDCCRNMFYGCTSLVTAPALPATTLAGECYYHMFESCTSLVTAPDLPVTTLFNGCYNGMFKDCTSLTTAPELPATTLANYCYYYMFSGCTKLNYIKCLATDISASSCTTNWVYGVAATGTFVKDKNMVSWTIGNNGIPTGWTTDTNQYVSLSTNEVCTCLDGSTITLNVSSNIPWTATNSNNWVTLSQSSGQSGNTTISLTINSSEIGRTGAITFNGTETLTINQYNYLTFDVLSDGYIYWKTDNNSSSTYKSSIQYNKNGIWRTLNYNDSLYANSGDVILFRGNKSSGQYGKYLSNNVYYNKFDTNVRFNVKGDIHSLFSYTFYDDTVTYSGGNFPNLFKGCTNLISAEDLILSGALSGSDTYGAYSSMFYGCTSLTKAPKVINNDISDCYGRAYIYMFYGCTSLTSAPALPATTLSSQCYYYMFQGCTSLTTAPVLPATTLISGCYNGMFSGCTSLNYIKCLATDISATNCTNNWVNNVAATGTFIKDSSMTSWSTGTYGIPSGWTVVDNT